METKSIRMNMKGDEEDLDNYPTHNVKYCNGCTEVTIEEI